MVCYTGHGSNSTLGRTDAPQGVEFRSILTKRRARPGAGGPHTSFLKPAVLTYYYSYSWNLANRDRVSIRSSLITIIGGFLFEDRVREFESNTRVRARAPHVFTFYAVPLILRTRLCVEPCMPHSVIDVYL